jgi:hypothetical protein
MSTTRKRLSNEARASRPAFQERVFQAAKGLEDRAWRLPPGPERRSPTQGSPDEYSQSYERVTVVAGTSGAEMTSYFTEALRDYRAFILGPDGHVIDRTDMFCANDEAAKKRAKQLVNGHDVELWHHDRKLAEFKHEV